MADRTTVDLSAMVPRLYARRDESGDWAKWLQILEDTLNDILSSQGTRAALACRALIDGSLDSVFEAVEEGARGALIQVQFVGDSVFTHDVFNGALSATCVTSEGLNLVTIHYSPGVTTVGTLEAAVAAEVVPTGTNRLIRLRTPGTPGGIVNPAFLPDGVLGDFGAFLTGDSPAGYVLGKVSVDAQGDIKDPLKAEARLLPYQAQFLGWDLDPSTIVSLQRKIIGLIVAMHKEKATAQGIVDALRLLIGIDSVYRDLWGDAWTLDEDALDVSTVLAPAPTAPGWARGALTAVLPSALADNQFLQVPTGPSGTPSPWGLVKFEIQRTAQAGGERAFGMMLAVTRSMLANNLYFVVQGIDGHPRRFEFKVDGTYQATVTAPEPAPYTIDVSADGFDDPLTGAPAVASAIIAQINAAHGGGAISIAATGGTPYAAVSLVQDAVGAAGNVPITGGAVGVLQICGLFGGANIGGGAFVRTASYGQLNLIGAQTVDDVLTRLWATFVLYFPIVNGANPAGMEVVRSGTDLFLRWNIKGQGDGAITGAAAVILGAAGMSGAIGPNPAVRTFTVTFPRHLTDDELRLATAIVTFMKRADTHFILNNPPAVVVPDMQLDVTHLGYAKLTRFAPVNYATPAGGYAADLHARYLGPVQLIDLVAHPVPPLAPASRRSLQLRVGGRYMIDADDDCFVRQGNRAVTACGGATGGAAALGAVSTPFAGVTWLVLTGLAGIGADHVGHVVRLSQGLTNFGPFLIVDFFAAGSIRIANPTAALLAAVGALTWNVSDDFLLPGTRRWLVTPTSLANAFLAALPVVGGGVAAFLRITRIEGAL